MLETSTRLLALLSLLQSRREWRGEDLAARLEVGPRTIRRDMDRLRRLGYPILATAGPAGGYRLGAGSELPPLLLDEEEAVAVAVGLRTSASVGVSGIEEASVRALAKLEPLLPSRLRRRVQALDFATVLLPGVGPSVDAGLLAVVAAACRDRERLRFTYRDREGRAERRLVEPLRLVHSGRRWYLVAFDMARDGWRTFRVDRMQTKAATDRRFLPREPPAADLADYVAKGIAGTRDRHRARVLLHAPLEHVQHRVPSWAGALEPHTADACILDASADWLGSLAIYIANLDVDFEVLDSPELTELVAQLGARFQRAASGAQHSA